MKFLTPEDLTFDSSSTLFHAAARRTFLFLKQALDTYFLGQGDDATVAAGSAGLKHKPDYVARERSSSGGYLSQQPGTLDVVKSFSWHECALTSRPSVTQKI